MEKQDKMTIEIDHEDMVNMVCGLDVEYDDIPTLEKMRLGYRAGTWEWDKYALEELSMEELYDIYKKIKNKKEILLPIEEAQDDPYSKWIKEVLKSERELFRRFTKKAYEMALEHQKNNNTK